MTEQPSSAPIPPVASVLVLAAAAGGFALGLFAAWVSRRPPGRLARARLVMPDNGRLRPPVPQQTGARRSGYVSRGVPAAERLRALDKTLASLARGDAGRVGALVERTQLFLVEAESPTLALADLEHLLSSHAHADEAAEAMFLRAEALACAGALSAALEAARDFVSHFPRSWRAGRAASLAADILAGPGRATEAEALARDVLARDPARAEHSDLAIGERGRFPARMEGLILQLGRLYLRSGDHAAAEGAFDLIAAPRLGAHDFGETFMVSPLLPEAEVGRAEAELAMGGSRAGPAREKLAALAERYALRHTGRRARRLLGARERSPGERALALAEAGKFEKAARAVKLSACSPEAAGAIARLLELRAWFDPEGTIELAAAIRRDRLGPRGRESICIALSRANEALGRAKEARRVLSLYSSERLAFARAELARRRGDAEGCAQALGSVAGTCDLAAALLEREAGR